MTPAARSITAGRSRLGAARSTSGRREAARFPEADGAARRGRQRPRRACRLPASDGRAKLTSTAVADVGCGLGASSKPVGWVISALCFVFIIFVNALELLVGGIQAYVFALLTALYINDAVNLH